MCIRKNTYEEFLRKEKAKKKPSWWNHPEINHSKRFLREFENARFKKYSDHSKNQLLLLTGFPSGHCRLRKRLIRMGLSDNKEFRFFGGVDLVETAPDWILSNLWTRRASYKKARLGNTICLKAVADCIFFFISSLLPNT